MTNTHGHPNSIFRWEDAASLEHACWQCPTKANSPRALQTCYGIHSMPCTSYHPTMHAIGAAHRCSGCVMTREMHDARHREIAELVAEYRALENSTQETPTRRTPLLERPPNLAIVRHRHERQVGVVRYGTTEEEYLHEQHNDLRSEESDDESIDVMSMTSSTPSLATETTSFTPFKKFTKAELRAQKKVKKSVKSQTKALKNQSRYLASVTSADVDFVAGILHGYGAQGGEGDTKDGLAHPLVSDKTIEDVIARNLNFVKSIQAHNQYLFKSIEAGRKETKERKRQKKRESRGELGDEAIGMDEVVSAIMIRLGIASSYVLASASASISTGSSSHSNNTPAALHSTTNRTPAGSNRKRAPSLMTTPSSTITAANTASNSKTPGSNKAAAVVVGKLRNAIKADLEKHENEAHMRYVRAGGFWRYVGKSVFERMTGIAREFDVSTGEKWGKKWVRDGKKDLNNKDENNADAANGEEQEEAVGEEAMVLD